MSGFQHTQSRFHFYHVRRAFTLVEMLVVMGILAILLAVTVPAFRGFNQGSARRGAVNNLMGVLDRARMMAVSDGLCTYVAFARKTDGGTQVNSALWGRAYAIFQDQDNVNFQVVQRTPWLYLPENVAFKMHADPATAPGGGNAGSGLTTASVTNQRLVPPGTDPTNSDPVFMVTGVAVPPGQSGGSLGVQLPYWKFDNTGAVDNKALAEQTQGGASSSDQRNNYLRLLLFTGYVNAGGQEVSTQNNGGSSNQAVAALEEIDVNPVTGRARYVVDPFNNLATPTPTPGT